MINDVIKSFLQQANSNGSRSNALKPLLWLIGIFLPALITSSIYCAAWVSIVLAIVLIVFCVFFVSFYWYCLVKNPDLLRSEKFNLDKMVVEQTRYNQAKNVPVFDINNVTKETSDNELISDIKETDNLTGLDKKDDE